jgi:hypothetical protein
VRSAGELGFDETSFGVFQDGFDLFPSDTGEPFEKFIHSSTSFEVLEERLHRYAGSLKNPGAAHFTRHLLYTWTLAPLKH